VYIFGRERERERRRETEKAESREGRRARECGQTQRADKRLLASSVVERSVGRFSRLRTPLGLVMRRLSGDRDRGTGCIPNATLYSAAMSDRTGMCSPLTHDGSLLFSLRYPSHRPPPPPTPPLRISRFTRLLLCIKRPPASSGDDPTRTGYFGPRGWLSNEIYGEHAPKVGHRARAAPGVLVRSANCTPLVTRREYMAMIAMTLGDNHRDTGRSRVIGSNHGWRCARRGRGQRD